jgi:hypothetical protein
VSASQVATSGRSGNRSACAVVRNPTRRFVAQLSGRDLGSDRRVAPLVQRRWWSTERNGDRMMVRPLRRAGRCAEARYLSSAHPFRGRAQAASGVPGCLQFGTNGAVFGRWSDFVELETSRVESSISEVVTPRGSFESMRSFLYGSSTELVRIVGHTLNAR